MKAHRFQQNYTGVQILVWHCVDELQARTQFASVVKDANDWTYCEIKYLYEKSIRT